MLKLPLEFLLERELSELGINLNRRVYAEEVVTEASFDDAFGEMTIAAYVDVAQKSGLSNANLNRLTPAQKDMLHFEGRPSFFTRTSDSYHGWTVEYRVESAEQRDFYEAKADRLIREGKIAEQYVDLFYLDHNCISIGINTVPDKPNTVRVDVFDVDDDSEFDAPDEILELNGKTFSPADVSRAVIDLLMRRF